MRIEVIKCQVCGWEHEEMDAQSAIPASMFAAFSDPPALAAIMARQRRERLLAALKDHTCTANPSSEQK